MSQCLICRSTINPFLSFGQMPSANAYLKPEQFAQEYYFELAVAFCEQCYMMQLVHQNKPENMFHDEYAFFSSTSQHMMQHFGAFADTVIKEYLPEESSFVVEIGSNDGVFLRHFAAKGIPHLGVEPSHNVAKQAEKQGVNVQVAFFNEPQSQAIIEEYGQADVITAANVIGHISDLHSVFAGIKNLLKPRGVFIFEHPYVVNNLLMTAYDQIYDEHVYYFSAHSVQSLLRFHGLTLLDLSEQPVHGGSMRYVIGHEDELPTKSTVEQILNKEQQQGITQVETYHQFAGRTEQSKQQLLQLLDDLDQQGKRVVGYGATAKSSTVINYCGLTTDHIECIYDITPTKQGKFSPGAHLPIHHFDSFYSHYPDYALLFAWNHAKEIKTKEQAYHQQGGKWINFVPSVHVD